MTKPELIYKIAQRANFAQARTGSHYAGMPIDAADGFMHFSTAAQLADTLRLHFAGQGDLVLLAVRTADLGGGLRWEASRGGDLFPHLHGGPLPLSAIAWQAPIAVASDGSCPLPEAVQ